MLKPAPIRISAIRESDLPFFEYLEYFHKCCNEKDEHCNLVGIGDRKGIFYHHNHWYVLFNVVEDLREYKRIKCNDRVKYGSKEEITILIEKYEKLNYLVSDPVKQEEPVKQCLWCYKPLDRGYPNKNYCDKRCSAHHRTFKEKYDDKLESGEISNVDYFLLRIDALVKATPEKRICRNCYCTFLPKKSDGNFCSPKCRMKNYNKKKKEEKEWLKEKEERLRDGL